MIKVRDIRGHEIHLPAQAASIEICSSDGKIGSLLLLTKDGAVLLTPEDADFTAYCRINKLDKAELVELT